MKLLFIKTCKKENPHIQRAALHRQQWPVIDFFVGILAPSSTHRNERESKFKSRKSNIILQKGTRGDRRQHSIFIFAL